MDNGTAVPELKRVMGSEGLALLKQHNLLRPLVQQMLMQETFAQVVVSDEELDAAWPSAAGAPGAWSDDEDVFGFGGSLDEP